MLGNALGVGIQNKFRAGWSLTCPLLFALCGKDTVDRAFIALLQLISLKIMEQVKEIRKNLQAKGLPKHLEAEEEEKILNEVRKVSIQEIKKLEQLLK
jgi:hypothetical protein